MKKTSNSSLIRILLPLLVVAMALLSLAGCGGSESEDNTEAIRAAADGFMTAVEEGDLETMKSYADPSLFSEGGDLEAFGTIETTSKEFSEALGMQEDELGDTTKKAVDDFMDTLLKNLVTSYTINEVTETEGVGNVKVTTTYGFDPQKMSDIDMNDDIDDMAEDYMNDHKDELVKIYQEDGEQAMQAALLDALLDKVLKKYTDAVMETGEVTQDTMMTLENQEGKWVVTADKPIK